MFTSIDHVTWSMMVHDGPCRYGSRFSTNNFTISVELKNQQFQHIVGDGNAENLVQSHEFR